MLLQSLLGPTCHTIHYFVILLVIDQLVTTFRVCLEFLLGSDQLVEEFLGVLELCDEILLSGDD